MTSLLRVGQGYDAHQLALGRSLILGGVEIPYDFGLEGHSDADVLIHSIMDALLGAGSLGDIGQLFPDTDPAFLGASSLALLNTVMELLRKNGYSIINIDSTVIAQAPKLKPYINEMRNNIALACNISIDCVSVKATTEEHMGFTGRKEGISAHAIVLLTKNGD